jgi:hypothetical protein
MTGLSAYRKIPTMMGRPSASFKSLESGYKPSDMFFKCQVQKRELTYFSISH